MYAVELININKTFKDRRQKEFLAAKNINLQIKEGEFFSLLGSSGCGKTTILRLIAGFEVPSKGQILIKEKLMNEIPPYKRPVNTVFQNYALFPHLTVAENMGFGLKMEKINAEKIQQRVNETLEIVKLKGFENRYPRQLSGGQQQRVALGRAIIKKPQVLLFDEPLAALDLKLRKEMQLELKHLQQKLGITFIYVTHDQEEALTMSDRIGVMHEGEILEIGTPLEIYETPRNAFVAEFIGETNFFKAQVVEHQEKEVKILINEEIYFNFPYSEELPIGKQLDLVIRPEKITIYPPESEGNNYYLATIEEIVYLGTDTRIIARLNDNNTIIIRQSNNTYNSLIDYTLNQKIKVKIPPENLRIINN